MPKLKVSFEFDVDFECQEENIKDEVTMWWSECTDVPDYTITEIEEKETL